MKFSTIEIRPSGANHDEWGVCFYDLDGDRIDDRQGPNACGFYHYPRHLGRTKAFEALKAHLIAKHKERISALQKSLSKLKALNVPDLSPTNGGSHDAHS